MTIEKISKKEISKISVVFLLLVLIFFIGPLLKGALIGYKYESDLTTVMSSFYYTSQSLKQFDLPSFWNPYWISGTPHLGNIVNASFYPPNILFLFLFNLKAGLNLLFIFHLLLAGIFMYLLARTSHIDKQGSFLAGLIYMFSGYVVGRIFVGHYNLIPVYAYIPGVLYGINLLFSSRKKILVGLLIGVFLSLQFFSGFPQIFLYSFLIYIPYFLFKVFLLFRKNKDKKEARRYLVILVLILLATIGFSAIQILPNWQISQYSDRAVGLSKSDFFSVSVHPWQMLTLLLPGYFNSRTLLEKINGAYFHESIMYCGFFTLVLVLAAFLVKKRRPEILFYGAIFVLVPILGFGRFGYLFKLFYYLPILSKFRVPARFLALLPLCLSMLAGYGFLKFKTITKRDFKKVSIVFVIILTLFLLFAGLVYSSLKPDDFQSGFIKTSIKTFLILAAISLAILFFKYLSLEKRSLISSEARNKVLNGVQVLISSEARNKVLSKARVLKNIIDIAVIVFIGLDLFLFAFPFVSRADDFSIDSMKEREIAKYIKNQDDIFRVATYGFYGSLGFDNYAPIMEVADASGPATPALLWYREFTSFLNGNVGDFFGGTGLSGVAIRGDPNSKLLDLLNVRYILVGKKYDGREIVIENGNYYPRFLYSSSYKVMNDRDEILEVLAADSYDPYNFVILEQEIEEVIDMPEQNSEDSKIDIVKMNADEIILEIDFKQNGILLINNIYYPEWSAKVDAKAQKIYKTNYIFQSLPLTKGKHQVKIFYQGKMLKIGGLITLATMFLSLSLVVYLNVRKRYLKQ